jgi:hypothetical protein
LILFNQKNNEGQVYMNAFNLFPAVVSVAPEVSAANTVMAIGNQSAQSLLQSYNVAYNLVWRNAQATPDKVIAAMGVNAKAVFAHAAALAAFLTNLGLAVDAAPANWTLVTNADNSMVATKAA